MKMLASSTQTRRHGLFDPEVKVCSRGRSIPMGVLVCWHRLRASRRVVRAVLEVSFRANNPCLKQHVFWVQVSCAFVSNGLECVSR